MVNQKYIFYLCAAVAFLNSGCASAGSSNDAVRTTVYNTHRLVEDLSQNLSGTVTRLSTTTAELVARLDGSEQEMRELMSVAQENQYKLEQLQNSLDTLTANLYRHLNLSPPEPIRMPAPTRPFPSQPDFDRGGITVEPPTLPPVIDGGVPNTTPAPVEPVLPSSADEDAHYREAQQMYSDENFAQAQSKFAEHLTLFPASKHSANATYWKAHCYFKMGDYTEAVAGFDEFRAGYPSSGKVPIAMHNQAVAYSRLGQNGRAIELFQRLIREYPDDVATEGARDKLRQLQSL